MLTSLVHSLVSEVGAQVDSIIHVTCEVACAVLLGGK